MLDLESLYNLSYAMCIVSSKKGDKLNGCTVNTVFQLTPEPPMIAISVNNKSLTREFILDSGVFAISVLAEGTDIKFIGRFGFRSGRDLDKFEGVACRMGDTGAPIVLENTVSFIEAEVIQSVEVETHTLFIGKIVACENIDNDKVTMTYTYYRDVKGGRTPKSAATYVAKKDKRTQEGAIDMKKYKCNMCGYVYDPAVGDPDNGVKAGTSFEALPGDWVCPECGVGKDEFSPVAD